MICNKPGCENEAEPPSKMGRPPQFCKEHRDYPKSREYFHLRYMTSKRGMSIEHDDADEVISIERKKFNIEIGMKKVEVVASPNDEIRPGARFDAADIIPYGNNFINCGRGAPVRDCWDVGTMFMVRNRNTAARYWITPERRIARVAT
jgi:hypothetical protein